MKNTLLGAVLLLSLLAGCQKDTAVSPEVFGTSPTIQLIGRDSLFTGSYLGMTINEGAETIYPVIQSLRQTKGVTFLNVVSNVSSDLTQLRTRIPLYQYILLDQNQGTDSGVQITVEADRVKSIYLNSGKKLIQWPAGAGPSSSVLLGDRVSVLYDKLVKIRNGSSAYAKKFERIFLLTKNLTTAYDPAMGQLPQWYFAYQPEPGRMDEVKVHFRGGKVSRIDVNHYRL